jgi:hypothetical protein
MSEFRRFGVLDLLLGTGCEVDACYCERLKKDMCCAFCKSPPSAPRYISKYKGCSSCVPALVAKDRLRRGK